ncbi:phosphoribulokinase [Synechococcus sp. MIT S1220]|uniref:phosphoribulokinase n=1 Tax=Synechococcus sp. MIT S1220 TaxID=3082549 RepID=UPI0039B0CB29
MDPDRCLDLSKAELDALLNYLELDEFDRWKTGWSDLGAAEIGRDLWAEGTAADWLWCLALPLLSSAQAQPLGQRQLIGLSALPGCGKTTLGNWLEAAAVRFGISLSVVSIDDFYLEAAAMEPAMAGNPWSVPRALPGSHDLQLMQDRIAAWKSGQCVELPMFDKTLRNGQGDRCGWRRCDSECLVLEGWFLGCNPLSEGSALDTGSEHLNPELNTDERDYRKIVQARLHDYKPIWNAIDTLWQLAAPDLNAPVLWKRQQNETQKTDRGVGLPDQELKGFIRMITASIPANCFRIDQADVVISVDLERRLRQLQVRS